MPPPVPPLLQLRSTDEYAAPAHSRAQLSALGWLNDRAARNAARIELSLPQYLNSPAGTAGTLLAINQAGGRDYYDVSSESAQDPKHARRAFAGPGAVFDVQTHYIADHRRDLKGAKGVLGFIRHVAPERFEGLKDPLDLSLAEFLRCVFIESETRVAVLTSAPGAESYNILSNAEIAGTRELTERFAGSARLLHHSIVHPNEPGELDLMGQMVERYNPIGFKVYTLYGSKSAPPWMLDDERCGIPFLENAQRLGVKIICCHKGLSGLAPTGAPADVGPAAARFPDLNFLVYHSGYEVAQGDAEEGAYTDESAGVGTNRLIHSVINAGIAPNSNVYAELGSTWYLLMRRPREAAHVLGKLLRYVGQDNVLWGTDSPWYGPTQPLIDAFRAFSIPEELQERHGYPALTDDLKAKILGGNAATVYGVDLDAIAKEEDDLSWIRASVLEAKERGVLPVVE